MPDNGTRMGALSAWISLAVMLSAQAGTAVWWAGVQNTRVAGIDAGVDESRRARADAQRQVMAADRQIAVLESRLEEVLRRLDRIGAVLDRIGHGR